MFIFPSFQLLVLVQLIWV